MVEVKHVSFTYPGGSAPALCDVSFSVQPGEFVLLMGPTGSGKSTLLRLLKKEIAPAGQLQGTIVCSASHTGFVFQNPQTSIVTDNVRSELAFTLENMGLDRYAILNKISEAAAFFHLDALLERNTASLSGGEKQMLALASVMVSSPQVLLLDEPTAQLDPAAAERLGQMILRLNRELGITVLMSSHLPGAFYADADRILLLDQGRLRAFDTPQDTARFLKAAAHPMLGALPAGARLFDAAPLTVRAARAFASGLREKEYVPPVRPAAVLEAKNLRFAYSKTEPDVLDGLSYAAYPGIVNAIVGANGSGKSTLLKVLCGVLKPYGGKVRSKLRMSLLPQNVRYLFTQETAGGEIQAQTADYLGLPPALLKRHPYDLSGGESKLLALGMQLETEADILFMDEPTAGLDAQSKVRLASVLQALCRSGKTIVLVTHDLDFVGTYAQYVAFLCGGALSKPQDRRVFFSRLDLYTTEVRRITNGFLPYAVSEVDLL